MTRCSLFYSIKTFFRVCLLLCEYERLKVKGQAGLLTKWEAADLLGALGDLLIYLQYFWLCL